MSETAPRPRALACLAFALALLPVLVVGPSRAGEYLETFDTSVHNDPFTTTANWNVAAGQLELYPQALTAHGQVALPAAPGDIRVRGTYAYVTAGNGLNIVDVRNPQSPVVVSTLVVGGSGGGVDVQGK